MKRIVSMLLAVALLLLLTACGAQNTASIVGTWQTEMDYAGVINTFVSENDVLAASGATLDKAPVTVTYTFSADGTATCTIDKQQLYTNLWVLFEEILTPVLASLSGKTLEEYVESSNMTREELLVSLFTEDVMNGMKQAVDFTGTYELKGDKLTVTVSDNTDTAKIKFDGDRVVLTAPIGATTNSEAQQAAVKALAPLTLTKVG